MFLSLIEPKTQHTALLGCYLKKNKNKNKKKPASDDRKKEGKTNFQP